LLALLPCQSLSADSYTTWFGTEPDKWASIWLIKTHLDPGATITILPAGSTLDNGISFGTPKATYRRSAERSTYQSLYDGFSGKDPVLREIGRVITIIETSRWAAPNDPVADSVEQAYRKLHQAFDYTDVPTSCYSAFFDTLYRVFQSGTPADFSQSWESLIADDSACTGHREIEVSDKTRMVRQVPIMEILQRIAKSENVVFIDSREAAEFDEIHIPGATNVTLRKLDDGILDLVNNSSLVISYCIKDFRGYEVAKKLASMGVRNVGIMYPYGLAGWKSLGLPVAGSISQSESNALAALIRCANSGQCLSNSKI
jgi:rhodanese-related sulfurtransferase